MGYDGHRWRNVLRGAHARQRSRAIDEGCEPAPFYQTQQCIGTDDIKMFMRLLSVSSCTLGALRSGRSSAGKKRQWPHERYALLTTITRSG